MSAPYAGPRFAIEPVELLIDLVARVEPALAASTIVEVVKEVTPTRARQRELARALDAAPELLTSGEPRGPRSVERFIRALQAAGATGVTPPRCANCHKPVALVGHDRDGQRVCAACSNQPRIVREVCAKCGNLRRVGVRGRDGAPRCRLCPPEPDRDHTGDICRHLQRLANQLTDQVVPKIERVVDQALLRGLVEQAIPLAHQRREVAWELDAHPERLTGQAAAGSAKLVALIELLARHEIPGIQRPACPFCRRQARLGWVRDQLRCCRRCYDASKLTTCSSCGRDLVTAGRTPDGRPQCTNCFRYDPINQDKCSNCSRAGVIAHREADRLLCKRCWHGCVNQNWPRSSPRLWTHR